jgi:hypothetical protein
MDFWTADRIDTLRRMHHAGSTCRDIGAAIGTSRNSVIGKLHRLGLAKALNATEWTPERLSTLRVMHISGVPYKQIAAACGAPEHACRQKASRMGLAPRPHNSLKRRAPSNRAPRDYTPKVIEGIDAPSIDQAADIVDATGCLWAITPHHVGKGDHLFCNHPKDGASQYCAYHAEMNRAKPVPRGQVKRFIIPTSLLRSVA